MIRPAPHTTVLVRYDYDDDAATARDSLLLHRVVASWPVTLMVA